MRIGFCSIYSWRPHVEHLHYLAMLVRSHGHEARFLTCDSDLPSCYGRELRPERSTWRHCLQCRIGGLRSFEAAGVRSIGTLSRDVETPGQRDGWGASSAATIGRFEAPEEFRSQEYLEIAARLGAASRKAYAAASRWIEEEKLDAICLFNGRMDATRGVQEAALDAKIPFVSVERTWFGDGLQLLPNENCLGLRSIDAMMTTWRDVPLGREQALRASTHIASRFLRRNAKEWRAYNTQAVAMAWPIHDARRKVLLVPSSRNEVWGHPDWSLRWNSQTEAFDALMDQFSLSSSDLVLRAHPNWAERIGAHDGSRADAFFRAWAKRRGVLYIASTDRTSTLGLIEQADAVVVCGGSAALEAGILGKQVIAVGPSIYQQARFQDFAYDFDQLRRVRLHADLPEADHARAVETIARRTLRFCHTMVYRVAQFVPYVRAVTTTRYDYFAGADPQRLIALLRGGSLQADDSNAAGDARGEDAVLELIAERRWTELMESARPLPQGKPLPIARRLAYRPIDMLRERLPRGDL
jgi:hypothetical protein